MQERVERLTESVQGMATQRLYDRRLVRIETLIEVAQRSRFPGGPRS